MGDRDGELCGEVEDRVGKLGFWKERRGKRGNFVEGQRDCGKVEKGVKFCAEGAVSGRRQILIDNLG